jgi:transcriptional regulator with XRE-family HTH domain
LYQRQAEGIVSGMDTPEMPTMNAAVAAVLNGEKSVRRVTIPRLQEATGLGSTTITRYLLGQRPIPIEAVAAIANAIGMTYAEVAVEAQRRYDADLRRWNESQPPSAGRTQAG